MGIFLICDNAFISSQIKFLSYKNSSRGLLSHIKIELQHKILPQLNVGLHVRLHLERFNIEINLNLKTDHIDLRYNKRLTMDCHNPTCSNVTVFHLTHCYCQVSHFIIFSVPQQALHIFLVSALWQKKNMPLCHANDSPKEYAALVKLVGGGVLL